MRGKVIAAFFLTCAAIALALVTMYVSFDSLLGKVDELSTPNVKRKTLNHLFEKITRLDQQQRADAIKNPGKSYRAFLKESKELTATLDSLILMNWDGSQQSERLVIMKRILAKRDFLLIDYLKLKSNLLLNKGLSYQLDSLSEILVKSQPQADSSVTTHQTKITTTTFLPEEKKRSFLGRLFSGKKKDSVNNRIEIKEEVSTKIDTLAIAQQDSAIVEVGRIMKSLDEDQRAKTKEILERELNLINTNITLTNQLLSILREVENEEMALIERKNQEAASVVTSTIDRISIIVIVFFLLAALLVLLIMLDIAKSNYYRVQLIKAKEEAEQLGMVKQRFMANMSHEIRTPLQSIIGFAEQLKGGQQEDMVNAIKHSSEHLLQIVDEVLDYSRIESGQFTLSMESFNLTELIREITSVVQIQAAQRNLKLVVNNFDSPSVVLGDSFRLRQILYNLLSNAIKFTAQGSIGFTCTITNETSTHLTCQFQITDTGKGIPAEDHERIFKQFEQGAGNINRHYGGSGLGLSIVKKLVDLQHGTITVRSEPGVGSAFTVTITFEKDLTPHQQNKQSITPALPYYEPVWVIDDDPLIIKLCGLILKNNKIAHRTFQKPELLLNENLNDVKIIFMDIRMPNINGIELCKQLKAKSPQVIIVALTAHVLPQEKATIMQSGFNGILTKPFREHDFLEALTRQDLSREEDAPEETKIDLSYLEQMTMGDQTLFNSILNEFHDETSKNLIDLEKRLLDQDVKGTREIIHQLAGRLGQFGARPLSDELKRIELQLHEEKKINEIPELRHVISQIRKFKTELSESVAENKPI